MHISVHSRTLLSLLLSVGQLFKYNLAPVTGGSVNGRTSTEEIIWVMLLFSLKYHHMYSSQCHMWKLTTWTWWLHRLIYSLFSSYLGVNIGCICITVMYCTDMLTDCSLDCSSFLTLLTDYPTVIVLLCV